jgi:hypothetical protein
MAIIKAVSSRASIAKAINYVAQDEKTVHKLVSGISCNPKTAIEEMKATKALWNKTDGRQYKHFVQSFSPDEKVTPELAHKIALELAEKEFKGFEVVIATHDDAEHIHTHFIVNSVNYENGKKFQQSKEDLQALKTHSDALCERNNLSICVKGSYVSTFEIGAYKAIQRAVEGNYKSYLVNTFLAVENARQTAVSRENFIELMQEQGYSTAWKKYITFTDKDGNRVRNSNLEKKFKVICSIDSLESQFTQNLKQIFTQKEAVTVSNITAGEVKAENLDDILRSCIDEAKSICKDRKEFQTYLQEKYKISMPRNTAKSVSFAHPSVGVTVRGKKLGADYTSEAIDKALTMNQEKTQQNVPLSFYEQIEHIAGKVGCNPKELESCLNTLKSEGINDYQSITYRIEELESNYRENHSIMKKLDDKNYGYKKAIEPLKVYQQYLPIYQESQSKKHFKKMFIEKHQNELNAFEEAKKQLNKYGLNPDISISKALNLINENATKVREMDAEIEATRKTLSDLANARDFIDKVSRKLQSIEQPEPDRKLKHNRDDFSLALRKILCKLVSFRNENL